MSLEGYSDSDQPRDQVVLVGVRILNQFGQKDAKQLDLTDILDPGEVRCVSMHFACNVVAKDPDTHLLFSRYELQKLVGVKGALFTTLGMHETTNFQSNLDDTGMNVSKELLGVLTENGKITFLQLYVDPPHAHLSIPYKHLVSGVIVTCVLAHLEYHRAMGSRAASYLRHTRDLIHRMVGQLGRRIEQVVRFQDEMPCVFDAAEFFHVTQLTQLLERRVMLVPFKHTPP